MYFNSFPEILYSLDSDVRTQKLVKDIFRRVHLIEEDSTENFFYYEKYTLLPGERAEDVADKIYDNSYYHWVILITNHHINGTTDWYKDDTTLDRIIDVKYGENKHLIKYYEDEQGNICDFYAPITFQTTDGNTIEHYYNPATSESFTPGFSSGRVLFGVTYDEDERRRNEELRDIDILSPKYLPEFVSLFQSLINS